MVVHAHMVVEKFRTTVDGILGYDVLIRQLILLRSS